MEKPLKFKKKPEIVEAMRYEGGVIKSYDKPSVPRELRRFVTSHAEMHRIGSTTHGGPHQWLPTILSPNGRVLVRNGDWVIKGIFGEFYSMSNEKFDKMFEVLT